MRLQIEEIIEESYLVYSEESKGDIEFNEYLEKYVITEDEEKIIQLTRFCERAKERLRKNGR
jgi:hypothetical protein